MSMSDDAPGWIGNTRSDGMRIRNIPLKTGELFVIVPNDERREIVSCPCCDKPLFSLRAWSRMPSIRVSERMTQQRYAHGTTVPAEKTRLEIERTLTKYGATSFGYMSDRDRALIVFECAKRHIKITLPLPKKETETRQRWRALLLVTKAKLESVASGIETVEQAFYANIVMPSGRTIYEETADNVRLAYETGKAPKLLPNYSEAGE